MAVPYQRPQPGARRSTSPNRPSAVFTACLRLNSKLHAVCDGRGRPLILLLTEGQVSDYRGAATVLPALPDADILIADRGDDSDWFREALCDRGIEPCIPSRKNRKLPVEYDAHRYKQRNLVERMFGRLKSLPSRRRGTGDASRPDTIDAPTPS